MNYIREYGGKVLSGKIEACHRIKQVYKLLIDKLDNPTKYNPWVFDEVKANKAIEFIETFCKQAQGITGAPLLLDLFQKAMLQAVFGFVHYKYGHRQYNELLTIIGRKNGRFCRLTQKCVSE